MYIPSHIRMGQRFILLFFSCMLSISFCQGSVRSAKASVFEIILNQQDPFIVTVKARLQLTGDSIYINPLCPSFKYTDGWSTFIKDIHLKDGSIPEYSGNASWALPGMKDKEVELSYQVDLGFVKEVWDAGNEQSGIFIDSAMFVVSRALFIYGNKEGAYEVRFHVPRGWSLATSWQVLENRSNYFFAPSLDILTNNTLVWGKPDIKQIKSGKFNLQVALLGGIKNQSVLLADVFTKAVSAYQHIYQFGAPVNYLVTLFYAAQQDGESYAMGNAFTLKDSITARNKIMWANQLAHELFHFWNGRTLQPRPRNEMQWFNEGFTEYYTNLMLLQTGIISEDAYWQKQEKQLALYVYFRSVQYPDVSMIQASAQKSFYRFGVYNGGAVAAFVLDILIQEKTKGAKNLDDLMRYMFTHYGINKKAFVLGDLENAIETVAGFDPRDFFTRYIRGTEILPFKACLDKIGYRIEFVDYEAEAYIRKKSTPKNVVLTSWKKRISVQ